MVSEAIKNALIAGLITAVIVEIGTVGAYTAFGIPMAAFKIGCFIFLGWSSFGTAIVSGLATKYYDSIPGKTLRGKAYWVGFMLIFPVHLSAGLIPWTRPLDKSLGALPASLAPTFNILSFVFGGAVGAWILIYLWEKSHDARATQQTDAAAV